MISVSATPAGPGWRCDVEVEQQGRTTRHTVLVEPGDLARFGPREGASAEDLVRRTFEFLLERESAGQILSSFRPADVERYFPEYGSEIKRR